MNDYGINKVFYTTDEGTISCEKVNNMDQTNISSGMRASLKNMDDSHIYRIFGEEMCNKIKNNK